MGRFAPLGASLMSYVSNARPMPYLSFPLFHGTSTALLSSIEHFGLGGGDPITALDAVSCLQRLVAIADIELSRDDWWASEADLTHRMCEQSISAAGFNFRHGQTYVSASELTAVRYAITNCVGSELLSTCIELKRRLARSRNERLAAVEFQFRELFALATENPEPVLLRLEGVSSDDLLSETGGPPESTLKSIESLRPFGSEALQGHNFILSRPQPCEACRVLYINVAQYDPYFPQYSLRERAHPVA